jgi:hypothetical protein
MKKRSLSGQRWSCPTKPSNVPRDEHYQYQKWLRYYHDFCHKYQFITADPDSLPYFIRKLHEKGQAMSQQEQAAKAIQLSICMNPMSGKH